MKIIVTSDWHLDWATGGLPRFADVLAAVQVIVDAAKREGAEMVMFLGDLTDPDAVRAHQAVSVAMWVATHLWFCAGIATRWLVGNHDVVEDGSGSSSFRRPMRRAANPIRCSWRRAGRAARRSARSRRC